MLCRKDVSGWVGITLLCLGCASSPGAFQPAMAKREALPPHPGLAQANAEPVPELRIPGKPAQATIPRYDSLVTQVSTQAPAKTPTEESAGPPLAVGQPSPSATNPADRLRTLHREAAQRYAAVDSYIVRLRRREQVNGKDHPEEILYVKFRKQPWSIYFKWLGKECNGREVVYVKGQFEDKIHTLLAAGDMPLMPAGKRIALAPDSLLVRSSSRYSIHEAGIGVLIERFGRLLDAAENGDNRLGSVKYLGLVKRPEFDAPCLAAEQEIPAGSELALPHGGRRLWLFDAAAKFPVLIIAQDETGHEVEYYCYDRFQFPVRLDDDDFNPEKLWNQKKTGPAKSNAP